MKVNHKLDPLKRELEQIESNKTKGAIICSRAKFYIEGEHTSKYFFGLEKSKSKGRIMTRLVLDDGKTVRKQQEILAEQKRFYQHLYTSNKSVDFQLKMAPKNRISDEQREELDLPLMLQELGNA